MEKGLRHGRFGPNVNWQHVCVRRAGASLLAASLLLSAVPATSFLSSAAPLTWSEGTDAGVVDQPPDAANGERPDADRPRDGASSVRQRGREAPIDLHQVAADDEGTPSAVGADPGDGPPPARKNEKAASEEQAEEGARNPNVRMWPMPAESYTFTQAFGCVPQIAHFYLPGAGCPADRPVVHTGLDLAAPEGTPFYAAASGWVTESGYDREVGVPNTRIIIQHEGRNDGYATEYLHWIASFVDVGDHVEAGQLIGEVGSVGYSTGPHLHFSLVDLDSGEHVDPTRWLPKEPGTEGYRGITPRRAAMRLPAGTTAGVPEYTDPNPPDVPVREDVPESSDAGKGKKDRGKHKKGKQREERRGNNGSGKNRDISGKDGSTSEDGAATPDDKQADRGRSRTRKRERNRDGAAKSHDASGEDSSGTSRKERRKKDAGNDTSSRKDDKHSSRKEKDPVEQTDTRDKGNSKNGNGGGGNKNDKNRQQDDTQQAAEETPAPVEEAPADNQEPQPGDTPGRDSQDGNNGDNADGGRGNGSNTPDDQDEATGDTSNTETSAREKGERSGSKGNNNGSVDGGPVAGGA
jgi:murein DD-endopeptidase MepM/ murein hydrolase activator NlpD